MRITNIEDLHCDSGPRYFSFLKISTDAGIVGWSEYTEFVSSHDQTATIRALAKTLIGQDPRPIEKITATLYAKTRQAAGSVNQRAVGAIENALLDIKAKALGIPVYELLGGPIRATIPLYWSHCGLFRIRQGEAYGHPPLRSLDDLVTLGREVRERGFKALKANMYLFDGERPKLYLAAWGGRNFPELNAEPAVLRAIVAELEAFREGAGPDVALQLDANFHFKTEGFLKLARALEPLDMSWLELDTHDPTALAHIRNNTRTPLASCETLHGRRAYKPFFEQYAMDVAIIDVAWNGALESLKIASLADTYEVNVATHNWGSPLLDLMSAHVGAAIPNLRIMEYEVDGVPWREDLVTVPPVVIDGALVLPTGPGWGTEIDEEAVRAHPAKRERPTVDAARA
jgi:L-alanine-DL-glutamate epimerase-like enolase superfamily enzyme